MVHLEECIMEAVADYKNGSIDKITPPQSLQKKKNKSSQSNYIF
jgi:hypothetical protein